ncbi:MAG: hypothetical protein M1302_04195 [Candidatus Thermoplasmatota archaeon]|nr:hypothetical protein [Candidatus Thermoplasmatota archaeon]
MAIVKSSVADLVIIFILIISVITIQSSSLQDAGVGIPGHQTSFMNGQAIPDNSTASPGNVYYLSSNLSVPANATYVFNSDHVYANSLSLLFINIEVYGKFELLNSTLSIFNTTYNTVRGINIILHAGSYMQVINSAMEFPGMLNGNRSDVIIDNSTIQCPYVNESDPLNSKYLGEIFSGSDVNIINSSVSGLIHQSGPYEFPDASMFVDQANYQEFSANGTIPMKYPVSHYAGNVLTNGIHLNVSYTGAGNESTDCLLLEVNGSVMHKYVLPYNTGNNSELSRSIYGSMFVHTASWFGNASNFSLVLQEDSPYPVGIINITLTLESNDTVHAEGYSAYDLMLYNSTADIVNSSLAINFMSNITGSGIPDFMANHIYAVNSTIIWTDSSVSGYSNYDASPFQLKNSMVCMYRLAKILPEDEGAMVSNFRYSISPVTPLQNSMLNSGEKNMTQYRILSSHGFIAMSGIQMNSSYEYTGEYELNWGTNETTISLEPFPDLPMGAAAINISVPAPVVTLTITGAVLYTGNLTVNMTYSAYSKQPQSFNGTVDIFAVDENGTRSNVWSLPISSLQPAILSLRYHVENGQNPAQIEATFVSDQMYALSGRSVESFPVDLEYQANSSIMISVAVTGYVPGTTWIMDYGGRYYVSNSSSLEFNTSLNLTPTFMPPAGYRISSETISYEAHHTEIVDISFSEITQTVTFVEKVVQPGQQWSVLLAGRNYSTTDSMLNVSLEPGVYNYEVIAPRGMEAKDSSGIVNLTDSNETVILMFFHSFSLVTLLDRMASQIVFYAVLGTAAGIAVTCISMRRKRSWYICRSCGASVDKGRKYCDKCESRIR